MKVRLPFFLLAVAASTGAAFAQAEADPQAPDTYQVKLETTAGPVVIEVKRELSPNGADRFYRLVKEGYYDDVRAFRVLPGFMAQFGMSGDPETNAKWSDARIKDDPVKASNRRGMVTFAKSSRPNSRTTQIFINYGDNRNLDSDGFAPFGRVIEGMENVDKFYSAYGEGAPSGNGPSQEQIGSQGNQYLDKRFPKLTKIETARVVSENGQPVEKGKAAR